MSRLSTLCGCTRKGGRLSTWRDDSSSRDDTSSDEERVCATTTPTSQCQAKGMNEGRHVRKGRKKGREARKEGRKEAYVTSLLDWGFSSTCSMHHRSEVAVRLWRCRATQAPRARCNVARASGRCARSVYWVRGRLYSNCLVDLSNCPKAGT